MRPRPRAAAIIIEDGCLLVIHRFNRGREYHVLPGGGVEPGETFEDACRREVREETGLEALQLEQVWANDNQGNEERYFMVQVGPGKPVLGGPEALKDCTENRFVLEWLELAKVQDANLLPEAAKPVCLGLR